VSASLTDADFTLAYADDFSGGSINHDLWGNPYGGAMYGNGAFAWSHDDVAVAGGRMVVSATRHADGGWTAGGINMLGAGNGVTYGRVEFDAKIDAGQGTGCAILLWPTANDHWPPEVDMIEVPDGSRQTVSFTNHWQGPGGNNDNQYATQEISVDATRWHHYQLDWTPDALSFYIDGVLRGQFTDHIPAEAMSFGVMGYVAADWESWYGGGPDSTTPSRVSTYLDNVEVYRWNGDTAVGHPPPVDIEAGSGPDTLVLEVSQDAYKGSARYTVAVDGVQVGGVFTASAARGSGETDTLTLRGDWGPGPHTVTVTHTNDLWEAGAGDRNLYVTGATYDGVRGDALGDAWYGGSFSVEGAWPAPVKGGRLLVGAAGDDTLAGGAGSDVVVGGLGDDRLLGRAGADRFGFSEGDGHDRVGGFQQGVDRLLFHDVAPSSVWAEAATRGGRAGVEVHYGDAGDTVFLANVTALGAHDYAFV
jgi:Ca2+-binding RTX toxin-like protein